MRPMETLPNLLEKAHEALLNSGVFAACNENAQTFMVKTEQVEKATKVIVNNVQAFGVQIEAKKGSRYSTFYLSVPTSEI